MWNSTVGLVNGKHRYLTAETFGFKVNSNGQALKKRQQWTIEPFPENLGPDNSVSSAASVSSQCSNIVQNNSAPFNNLSQQQQQQQQPLPTCDPVSPSDACILTFNTSANSNLSGSNLISSFSKSSLNGSGSGSDQEGSCEEHENVAIKSHLNKYLAVDSFGNVTCDSDEKTENARFTITICSMSQGRSKEEHIFWAFKNVERGYFLGTNEDGSICCNAKMPKSRAELWHLHLIPARGASFFALKSLGRKRFARATSSSIASGVDFDCSQRTDSVSASKASSSAPKQVQLDATISWGPETLFQFKYFEGGRYSILSNESEYLTNEGKCINWRAPDDDESAVPPAECQFTLEYHSSFLAFRDSFGHYLAAAGRSSVLRSRSVGVSRDELFVFESAPIQVAMKATSNNRWVSIKQGLDVSANQSEVTNSFETFQLTYHKQTQYWSIMTHDCNFWTASLSTNTIAVCEPANYDGLIRGQFKLLWNENDATCSLKYVDFSNKQEKWISARKSGQLYLTGEPSGAVKFIMHFQNRKLMNLRPTNGSCFVGAKTGSSCGQLEATKTSPDSISIEYFELPTSPSTLNEDSLVNRRTGQESAVADESLSAGNNIFNIKLNSTRVRSNQKNGSLNSSSELSPIEGLAREMKKACEVIDDNNNSSSSTINDNNTSAETSSYLNPDQPEADVESSPNPSVASIISSFANLSNSSSPAGAQKQQSSISSPANRSVQKLASSFVGSSPSSAAPVASHDMAPAASASLQGANNPQADRLAQVECCYLKNTLNDRYLVIRNSDSAVICDATNKACAQAWILELRSQNSVAIRASDNHAYMQLGQNGIISMVRCEPKEATLWEF